MNRATFFLMSACITALLASVLLWAYSNPEDSKTDFRKSARKPGGNYVFSRGLKASQYIKGEKVLSAKIDLLRTAPKNVNFFMMNLMINPLHVLEIYNAEIDVYQRENPERDVAVEASESSEIAESMLQLGRSIISRDEKNFFGVDIRNLKVNFFEDKELRKTIIGRQASFDHNTKDIVFKGSILLTTPESRSICRSARWNLQNNSLDTEGQCVQTSI